jgi:hypothetical protein
VKVAAPSDASADASSDRARLTVTDVLLVITAFYPEEKLAN